MAALLLLQLGKHICHLGLHTWVTNRLNRQAVDTTLMTQPAAWLNHPLGGTSAVALPVTAHWQWASAAQLPMGRVCCNNWWPLAYRQHTKEHYVCRFLAGHQGDTHVAQQYPVAARHSCMTSQQDGTVSQLAVPCCFRTLPFLHCSTASGLSQSVLLLPLAPGIHALGAALVCRGRHRPSAAPPATTTSRCCYGCIPRPLSVLFNPLHALTIYLLLL